MSKEHAWRALELAELPHDRRYSLSVLLDAYESDQSLDELLKRLAAKNNLTEDEQNLRIDLLRRLKRYDEAFQLVAGRRDPTISPAAQLKLLNLYRSIGRNDEVVAEYKKLIGRGTAAIRLA